MEVESTSSDYSVESESIAAIRGGIGINTCINVKRRTIWWKEMEEYAGKIEGSRGQYGNF